MTIDVKLLSLNVRGLRNPTKRREIFRWLKRFHDGDNCFVFLQETHSISTDEFIWQREWGSKIIFSHGTNLSKGVAICFPQKYNYELPFENSDTEGRKVIVTIQDDNECISLVNIYAPTKDNTVEHLHFVERFAKI